MTFKDHFSERAPDYSVHRPTYPPALLDFLVTLAPRAGTAWEAGCGSGQLTAGLAARFGRVFATDASLAQLSYAPPLRNVAYHVATAEDSGLADSSADLCVAAQAAHWFDIDGYWDEVRRVSRGDAAVALVGYSRFRVDGEEHLGALTRRFYDGLLATYWGPERRQVERGYRDLSFPFAEVPTPALELRVDWSLGELVGYIGTWSAVRKMERAEGPGAFDDFVADLSRAWGDPAVRRTVRWDLAIRAGHTRSAGGAGA